MSQMKSWLRIFFPKKYTSVNKSNEIDWDDLESKLKYQINQKNYFEQALRHRSHLSCSPPENMPSNERLEFLGDSIVNFITAEFIFNKFENAPEGELTRMRTVFVSREFLSKVGKKTKSRKVFGIR